MRGTSLSLFHAGSTLYAMLRHPHVERKQLVAFQNERVRRLVAHAYRNVAYYRGLFDRHGVKPDDIHKVEDLRLIPTTSRKQLQALPPEQIIAGDVNPQHLIWRDTSGSSGRSLRIRRTWLEERLHGAFRLRALRSLGLRAHDRHCYVMGQWNSQRPDHQIIQRLLATFGIARQVIVDFLLPPEEIVCRLKEIRPAAVTGYPVVLARIAQVVDKKELQALRLRFVGTGGDVLTSLMRQQIEEGFGALVYDMYGSHEFNLLAWQCRTTGDFHTCDDGLVTEVLQGDRPVNEGESGEVVGTDLHSFAMPLIRYRLGDVVTKGSPACRCGQPFSTIRTIRGRMIDYFHLPDGRVVHPFQLWGARREKTHWIRQYQVTQERIDRIVLRVVPWHAPSAQELAAVQEPAISFLGPLVRFEVNLVPEIRMEPNGKFRVFRSFIDSPYDQVSGYQRETK
jgi:phenylacetate-CoA ligase